MKVQLINPRADKSFIPERLSENAAGYDLRACLESDSIILHPNIVTTVPLGIAIQLEGYEPSFAALYIRSGLSNKFQITLINGVGVIDMDYTGELKAGLLNTSIEPYKLNHGDRVVQLVVHTHGIPEPHEVDVIHATARGANGFGSTGNQ